MTSFVVEQDIEDAVLDIFQSDLGYSYYFGPDISPDSENALRKSWSEVILEWELKEAIEKLNPQLTSEVIEEVIKKVKRIPSQNLIENNKHFHKLLVEGVPISYRNNEGRVVHDTAKLISEDVEKNKFTVINQFTIIENEKNRRPDLIVFLNGLPIAVIELKNPIKEKASLTSAYKQLEVYKEEISSLFNYNEFLVISDGTSARIGTITSSKEWFLPWKSSEGKTIASKKLPQLPVLLEGVFKKSTLIDLIKYFVAFSTSDKKVRKILAGYHQYYATNKAIKRTIEAIGKSKKAGVIWHTQGSGKSFTLAFYTGKLQQEEKLKNPTVVVLTDRNDLDDQLFNTFSSIDCLREPPVQANSKEELKQLLKNRPSGGIIFATIQKFGTDEGSFELLSDRSNIIVAADEAHRSHYGFKAKVDQKTGEVKYGFAKYLRDALPNATFIGFTGTPIDLSDRSTRLIFGDYIDVYDIEQSIEDGRTVKIFYESRLAKIGLNEKEMEKLDEELEEVTETEEEETKEELKSKWSKLEKIVGSDERLELIAKDLVKHFEERQEAMNGKAMFVGMSRRICIELYEKIKKLRPEWVNEEDDSKGLMKVVITGSAADGKEWQKHIRDKRRRRELGELFKDPSSEFKLAIVRDMWLTGFDVPSLNTLYVDKPMKGHGLMQAIARVNRVYKDKQGGLIVDYIGIAPDLKTALAIYSKSNGRGRLVVNQEEAISVLLEKYEVVSQMFHGFNYKKFFEGSPREKMEIIPEAIDFILSKKEGKKRFIREVTALTRAYSLAVPSKEASEIREDIGFFQAIKTAIIKTTEVEKEGKSVEEMDTIMKQLVSKAITGVGVIDVFKFAGLEKPDLSILSDEFLEEVQNVKYKNLTFETLRKLLNDEIKVRFRKNKVKRDKFSELIKKAVLKYENRNIDSAMVIKELVEIAHKIKEEKSKGEELGLSEEEEAFYDALANNESAKEILGESILIMLAREISKTIRENATIDWTLRENVQAKLRVMVKRLLKKYGYPPDKRKMAVELVLKQAEEQAKEESVSKMN